ncbi:response regulator [uncultured Flavobacterium sp.]|uniref:response regulator n=1 Tax=uncultured Flavobacterium sp. TaxID=165435 RepID=UPI0025E9BED8|nr:response regulator [uncultured Flavobacterium sp.]
MKQHKLHILIAEDDIDDGEIIEASFARHPSFLNVDMVKNGQELLDFLKNAEEIPDIILTDINMPILNGIEALAEIHEDSSFRNIPAFVYSTAINPSYEAKCKELGTKGFLIKPFELEEFYEIPNRILYMLGLKG